MSIVLAGGNLGLFCLPACRREEFDDGVALEAGRKLGRRDARMFAKRRDAGWILGGLGERDALRSKGEIKKR